MANELGAPSTVHPPAACTTLRPPRAASSVVVRKVRRFIRQVKYDIRRVRKLTHEELVAQRLTDDEARAISRYPIAVILEDIRSLYNVGSIFRTADAFRVQELVLCGFTPTPPRKEIAKTALGADATVPWSAADSAVEAITAKKAAGWTVLALELTDDPAQMAGLLANHYPLCLVVGNELTGVSAEALAACHGSVAIPMHGVKHSLNVAVATGIALYEAVRQLP